MYFGIPKSRNENFENQNTLKNVMLFNCVVLLILLKLN